MHISIFGNVFDSKDSILVKLKPKLEKKFPQITFLHQDPVEDLFIPSDEWTILDSALGIQDLHIFHDLSKFEKNDNLSVHGYDLYLELKLLQKIKKLPHLNIIVIPYGWDAEKIYPKVVQAIDRLK